MTRYLGANFDYGTAAFKPYFNHLVTKEPVFIMWDIFHMVKLVRNTSVELLELKDGNNNPIKWEHICKLYQKEVDEGLKKPLAEDTVESIKIAAEEIKTYISKLQLNNVNVINSPRKTGFLGLIICLEKFSKSMSS